MIDDNWLENEQLHFAAQDGDFAGVKQLINEGAPLNAFDETGNTPLHYAVENEHLDIVKFLISVGADVNAHDESQIGNTPLAAVAAKCSLAMAKLLLDAGADPTIPGWMQLTALHRAADRKRGDGQKIYQLFMEAAKKYA